MDKKEVAEIKKQFTPANCNITRIATCYINHEKEVLLKKTEAFLALDEGEQFKYFDIFKKTLSGRKGKTLYDIEFPTENGGSEKENLLNNLRKSKLKNEDLLDAFYQRVMNTYNFGENYLIVLIHGAYDVPGKTSDGMTMEDASDEVYDYVLCAICPVGLSKPGLSINAIESKVENRTRDWVVEMPAHGFLHPAFNDRSMDLHSMLYYTKRTTDMQPEFSFELTGVSEPLISIDEEHAIMADIVAREETLDFATIRNFTSQAQEEIEESLEELKVSPEKLASLLEDAGISDVEVQSIVNTYKDRFGGNYQVSLASIVDKEKTTIKTGNCVIKVDTDCIHEVEVKKVDSRLYMMIPLNNTLVEVNGMTVKGMK